MTSGATFLPASRAAPSEIGSPVPRSATITLIVRYSSGRQGHAARVVRLGVVALVAAQASHGMRPFGFEAVLLTILRRVLPDHLFGRRPGVVHLLLIGEVAVA